MLMTLSPTFVRSPMPSVSPVMGINGAVALASRMLASGRYRVRLGDVMIEVRSFPPSGEMQFALRGSSVLLVAPLCGEALIEGVAHNGNGADAVLGVGQALLLLCPAQTRAIWQSEGLALVLHTPRQWLQAHLSCFMDMPVRLSGRDVTLRLSDGTPQLFEPLITKAMSGEPGRAGDEALEGLRAAIVEALSREGLLQSVTRPSASVRRALDYIREDCFRACDSVTLSRIARVTERKLRDNFHKCMGQPLSSFVMRCRLENLRTALSGREDARPLQALAEQAGFTSAGAFSRAYSKAFGESPVQTRARAVRGI